MMKMISGIAFNHRTIGTWSKLITLTRSWRYGLNISLNVDYACLLKYEFININASVPPLLFT